MKKLPWSSITSGFVRNLFVVLTCGVSAAETLPAKVISTLAEHRPKMIRFMIPPSMDSLFGARLLVYSPEPKNGADGKFYMQRNLLQSHPLPYQRIAAWQPNCLLRVSWVFPDSSGIRERRQT